MLNPDLYEEWMRYARADSIVAQHLITHHPILLEIVCFHCQQAGEKALKAILAYYDERVPRTHDLREILQQCEEHVPKLLSKFAEHADQLTNFAVITRYPNEEMKVTEADLKLALEYAKQILEYVEALIGG
jgi:HEPN domain-containing protein